jgi:hypothetical protein
MREVPFGFRTVKTRDVNLVGEAFTSLITPSVSASVMQVFREENLVEVGREFTGIGKGGLEINGIL